jgi:hypothetical protein
VDNINNRLIARLKKTMLVSLKAAKNLLSHRAWLNNSIQLRNGLGPLSGRSLAILVFTLYLLLEPITLGADIVSAALAYGILALLFITTIVLAIHYYLLKRGLSIEVLPPHTAAVSNQEARLILRLSPLRIIPGCHLDLALEMEHAGASVPTVRISGFTTTEHRCLADIIFPHRGTWAVKGIRCTLIDALGLVRFSWSLPQSFALEVLPPQTSDSKLPILSSTQRAGDLVLDTNNRNGDPYDIKPYHPSDGVKKIVWKAYAKRGELLSRHPEASMTPEGHVVIVVLAERTDDTTCSHALAYIRNLEKLALDIVVGCLGRKQRPVARTLATAESLLVESTWDTAALSLEQLQAEISSVVTECHAQHTGIAIAKILLFCSAEQAAGEGSRAALYDLGAWMEAQGIEPTFCLTAPERLLFEQRSSRFTEALVSLTLRPAALQQKARVSASEYQLFLSECLRKQWEVYV